MKWATQLENIQSFDCIFTFALQQIWKTEISQKPFKCI